MTNFDIIFTESQKLAENGVIGYTGRTLTFDDGSVYRETEAIHTFAEWKRAGFKVNKGEHAIAKFAIWNYTDKPSRRVQEARTLAGQDTEAPDPHYYMKESAFFKESQVTRIEQ